MKGYLSRLVLEPRHRDVQRDLADCQRLHRRIMDGFPQQLGEQGESKPRKACGVLFRVESSPGGVQVLVQSRVAPSWERLPEGYLQTDWLSGPGIAVTGLAPLLERIEEGAVFRFRLRANPSRTIDTKTGPDGARRHGKRVPLRQESSRLAWLERKASQAGFALVELRSVHGLADVTERQLDKVEGFRQTDAGRMRLTFEGVQFDGRLRVVNAASFEQAVVEGIGPGKAYGFGLVSLVPE